MTLDKVIQQSCRKEQPDGATEQQRNKSDKIKPADHLHHIIIDPEQDEHVRSADPWKHQRRCKNDSASELQHNCCQT